MTNPDIPAVAKLDPWLALLPGVCLPRRPVVRGARRRHLEPPVQPRPRADRGAGAHLHVGGGPRHRHARLRDLPPKQEGGSLPPPLPAARRRPPPLLRLLAAFPGCGTTRLRGAPSTASRSGARSGFPSEAVEACEQIIAAIAAEEWRRRQAGEADWARRRRRRGRRRGLVGAAGRGGGGGGGRRADVTKGAA